jgi:sterol 3beta-glucosyltransferase
MEWMEYIHVCGYWHLDNADVSGHKWEPPVELLDFMSRARAADRKLVYIGFGSIVVSDPAALTSTILEAVDQAGVWAIISKGWSDRLASDSDSSEAKAAKKEKDETDLGLLPEHVFNIASIPHDWLFPRVDAVCHHG